MKIESTRLILESLSLENLIDLISKHMLNSEGINISDLIISDTQKRAIRIKIDKMQKADKNMHVWYTYWLMINKINHKAIGFVGFKGISKEGSTEIGYGITKKFEGNGYMTEAVQTLSKWALKSKMCKVITAPNVLKTNIGSQKVLLNSGFKKIKESDNTRSYILSKYCL